MIGLQENQSPGNSGGSRIGDGKEIDYIKIKNYGGRNND